MSLIIERSVNGGSQKVYRFPNNYGASVVCHDFSYGGDEGLSELAVLEFPNETDKYKLTYETEVTDDVIGYLSDEEVEELLIKISNLKGNI